MEIYFHNLKLIAQLIVHQNNMKIKKFMVIIFLKTIQVFVELLYIQES
jgi:hypothetical protein